MAARLGGRVNHLLGHFHVAVVAGIHLRHDIRFAIILNDRLVT